jgi:uracil-DNA glycosylase
MHTRLSQQTSLRCGLSNFNRHEIDSTSAGSWAGCTRCGLHRTRTRIALKRRGGIGRIRLLLIGEAPGEFEDILGVPFVGPAGTVLDRIITATHTQFQFLITNTVLCRPQTIVYLSSEAEDTPLGELCYGEDYEIQDKNRDPDQNEMRLCRPHIDELAKDFQPHGVVYLGKVAKFYPTKLPTVELYHPAYILRLEYKLQTLLLEAQKLSKFIKTLNVPSTQT